MKKLLCFALLLCVSLLSAAAEAPRVLELAFGLFSVEVPAEAEPGALTGNMLYDLHYELGNGMLVYANYSPEAAYETDAWRKLNSCVSMMYALGGPGEYTETEITEETLPGGMRVRWQLMRGSELHTLWFEAFSGEMGYNMVIAGAPTEENDAAMLAMMRSFRVDADREKDILQIRQTKTTDGSFISAEHGLQIQLDEGWNPVALPELLLPQTAFILEKDDGRWLIQLLYTVPADAGDGKALLDWYVGARGGNPGEASVITLENLGVDAWVAKEESGIFMRHIAFVYQGYGYYGSFMWLVPDDVLARPVMDAAIQSLAPAE